MVGTLAKLTYKMRLGFLEIGWHMRTKVFHAMLCKGTTETRKVSGFNDYHICFSQMFYLCNLDLGVHSTLRMRQQSHVVFVDTLTYQLAKPHLPCGLCDNKVNLDHRLYTSPIYAWIRTESCFLFFCYPVLHQLCPFSRCANYQLTVHLSALSRARRPNFNYDVTR